MVVVVVRRRLQQIGSDETRASVTAAHLPTRAYSSAI
jgi:hypothetical protein